MSFEPKISPQKRLKGRVHIYPFTDKTLTVKNAPADAKATGERIESVKNLAESACAMAEQNKNAISDEKRERKAEIAVERERINGFLSLPEGSTTGDAELRDIRTGCDGTVYATAGVAVREQVGSLNDDVVDLNSLVKGAMPFGKVKNSYVTESGVITPYSGWDRTEPISCEGITTFYITMDGYAGNYYNAFYDADNQFIVKFASYLNPIVVPKNAATFILSAPAANLSKYKIIVDESIDKKVDDLRKNFSDCFNEISIIKPIVTGELPFRIVKNSYVTESGVITPQSNWDRTEPINCEGLTVFNIETGGYEGNNFNAFYDAENQFIIKIGTWQSHVAVPPNAVTFILSAPAENLAKYKIIVGESINKKVDDLRREESQIVKKVNGFLPDEEGNVNIPISSQGAGGADGECYFVRKEMKPYFIDYPEAAEDINADSYIDGKISSVPKGKSFIFVTDMHYPENNNNSFLPMLYAYKKLGLRTVIHGGDVLHYDANNKNKAALTLRKWTNDMRSCFGEYMLPVFGNHDGNWAGLSFGANAQNDAATIIPYAVVEKIFLDRCRKAIVQETEEAIRENYASWLANITDDNDKEEFIAWCKLHYYFDETESKTRHIILNRTGFSPLFQKYFRGLDLEFLLQFDWLYGTLLGTPDDYNVVVTSHIFVDWQTNSITNGNALKIMSLLSFFKTNASGTFTVATGWENNAIAMRGKSVDFSSRNRTGKVVCLCGHAHWDYACICHDVDGTYKSEDYTESLATVNDGILCIMTQTDAIRGANYDMSQYPSTAVQARMTNGTVTEQCFDVVTIGDDKVTCTRFGAGNDRVFVY